MEAEDLPEPEPVSAADRFLARKWRGLALPISQIGGNYFRSSGSFEVIWSSILMILMTPRGLRLYDPEFGSQLQDLLFEPNDEILALRAKHYIQDAVAKSGEDRIAIRTVNVDAGEDNMTIAVVFDHIGETYTGNLVLRRNETFNLVSSNIWRTA